jgi:dinuclear metal center YbgI/SA1388 family protein
VQQDRKPQGEPSGAVERDRLVAYLDDLLDAQTGRDYCPNGLQVEGRPAIRKLVTAVSACRELFERAADADAVLVHHGLFWDGMPRQLTGVQYRRVAAVIRSGANLLAYHLPLDRHDRFGNNAVAVARLGLSDPAPFGEHDGRPIGFAGRYAAPIAADELVARCRTVFGQQPLAFAFGPPRVASVGIVSGAAEREVYTAIDQGLDAFITGEATEWVMNLAKEAGIHFLACGHYATERLGVRALGEHLAQHFGLDVDFIDIPNPV